VDRSFIDNQWRARRAPDADCVLLADGTLHVMDLMSFRDASAEPPAMWLHLLSARDWTPINWMEIDAQNASSTNREHHALAGEASADGSIGWVALTQADTDQLCWLAVSRRSNPFSEVEITPTQLIARTTLETTWRFPVRHPERVTITHTDRSSE
jgi:hypothetical protein